MIRRFKEYIVSGLILLLVSAPLVSQNRLQETRTGRTGISVSATLQNDPLCTEPVAGEAFDWQYSANDNPPSPIVYPMNLPATNYGFVFDIYRLDNSFNMTINGVQLATMEIEFEYLSDDPTNQNIRFADGTRWHRNGIPAVWDIQGTPDNPSVRVRIWPDGTVSLYGSKSSGGPLEPLELYNGNSLNTVSWNTNSPNQVEITQNVVGRTIMDGFGAGVRSWECETYRFEKSGAFNDESGDGVAQPGETVSYYLRVINLGDIDIYDVTVEDPLFGGPVTAAPGGDVNNDGILNTDEEWVYTVHYELTQADIDNGGIYNLATVSGKDSNGDPLVPKTSVDPNPLSPGDPNYDPARPDHTFVSFQNGLCFEDVAGEAFNWSYSANQNPPDPITHDMLIPGTDGGFVFDIYNMDNSFNMTINGVPLAAMEIEFENLSQDPTNQTTRFADGTRYQSSGIPAIWNIQGTPDNPSVRVRVWADGTVSLYGSKSSGGPLEPLELYNGNSLNTVTWNTGSPNLVQISQKVVGRTIMDGYGAGKQLTVCETYVLEKDGSFNDENNDGIAQPGETISYVLTVKNLGDIDIFDVVVEDPLLGGPVTVSPSGDLNNDGVLNKDEEWVYTVSYPVTQQDIHDGGVYNQAQVSGKNAYGEDQDPVLSYDPTPLDPADPNYDPARPDHTFVPLQGRTRVITNPMIYQRAKNN